MRDWGEVGDIKKKGGEMSEHTPLMLSSDGEIIMHICRNNDHEDIMATCLMPSDAQRLIDCWNACAGMEDPAKEIALLKRDAIYVDDPEGVAIMEDELTKLRYGNNNLMDEIKVVQAENEQLKAQNQILVDALKRYVCYCDDCTSGNGCGQCSAREAFVKVKPLRVKEEE